MSLPVTVGPITPQGWLKVSLRDNRRNGKQAEITRCGIRPLISTCIRNYTHNFGTRPLAQSMLPTKS